jgi:hypothetical protein
MRSLITTATLLLTVFTLHAGFAGFEVGSGVALTGGVVQVNYMGNKMHSISLGPRLRLTLIEIQLTLANGKVNRHTMFVVGKHALRVPLPIELTEVLGPLCLLALVGGIIITLSWRLPSAEHGASPNGGLAARLGDTGGREGPPSVS